MQGVDGSGNEAAWVEPCEYALGEHDCSSVVWPSVMEEVQDDEPQRGRACRISGSRALRNGV